MASHNLSQSLINFNTFYEDFYVRYIAVVLYTLAIIGNLLCLYVTMQKSFRRETRCANYLSALAISDTIFVIVSLVMGRYGSRNWQANHTNFVCKGLFYIYFISAAMSPLIITLWTAERFIAVNFTFVYAAATQAPLKSDQKSSKKSNLIQITMLTITLISIVLVYIPLVMYNGATLSSSNLSSCSWNETKIGTEKVFVQLDHVIIYWIPSIVIVICNSWIIYRTPKSDTFGGVATKEKEEDWKKKVRMLQIVSMTFFFLQLPVFVMHYVTDSFDEDVMSSAFNTSAVVHKVCLLPYQLNFMLDFVIYNLASAQFRQSAKNAFKDFNDWVERCTSRKTQRSEYYLTLPVVELTENS